jgi:hypothetical protein
MSERSDDPGTVGSDEATSQAVPEAGADIDADIDADIGADTPEESEESAESAEETAEDLDDGPAESTVTGHPAVDEVLRSLDALEGRPVDEHVAAFEDAHEQLRRALSSAGDDTP